MSRPKVCEHKKAEQQGVSVEKHRDPMGHEVSEVIRHMRCLECKSLFGRTDWEATAEMARGEHG